MKAIQVLSPAGIAERSSIPGVKGTRTQTGGYSIQRQAVLRGARQNSGAGSIDFLSLVLLHKKLA
jgi:hypothetical protein